ncbi:E3 ubiquitin-protein ligase MPSR1-like [Rhododendron vialii]|uniref:E3 ubiquitin-protein ligase MPSR1-like n=1 Tax=Rhododendron vialii TaxID=182163 RepID=UPI00265E8A98|nr:E3 ubiquitin-protein ligase MPSR1-like [Rhododendron vialii]
MPTSEANTPPPQQSPPPPSDPTGGLAVLLPVILGFREGLLALNSINPLTASATVIHFAEGPNQPSKDGPLPASKKSIEDMPKVKITEETDLKSESSCAICLGEYEVGGEAKEMPCKHRYHPGCIEKWLGIHGLCPVCRYEMPVEEDGDGGSKGSEGESRREQGEIRISIFYGISSEGGSTDDGSSTEDMEID